MKATTRRLSWILLAMLGALILRGAPATAQEGIGVVEALEGTAEVLHPGTAAWTTLAVGDGILVGDQVRTAAASKVLLRFREDTALTVAASSQLTITEQVAGPQAPVSRFSLLVGTVRAFVTERYAEPGARFELETPTAIAGVRGTGFIATYDVTLDETLVVGLVDTTLVRSLTDPTAAQEVRVGPGEATRVRRGSYPLRPTLLPEDTLRSLSGSTDVSGGGAGVGRPTAAQKTTAVSSEQKVPKRAPEAAAPESKVIDQPVEQLRKRGGGRVPPPPPR
jgi:hypothetical protein